MSGPLVRSSYRAGRLWAQAMTPPRGDDPPPSWPTSPSRVPRGRRRAACSAADRAVRGAPWPAAAPYPLGHGTRILRQLPRARRRTKRRGLLRRRGGRDGTPAKQGRIAQLKAVFQMTRQADPAVQWWMLLAFAGPVVVGVLIGLAVGHPYYVLVLTVPLGLLGATFILARRAERAAYPRSPASPARPARRSEPAPRLERRAGTGRRGPTHPGPRLPRRRPARRRPRHRGAAAPGQPARRGRAEEDRPAPAERPRARPARRGRRRPDPAAQAQQQDRTDPARP